MSKRKKQEQAADVSELKRIREALAREANRYRTRAGSLAVARDELLGSAIGDYKEAVAFLQGQVRVLYSVAAALDDLRMHDDCPF